MVRCFAETTTWYFKIFLQIIEYMIIMDLECISLFPCIPNSYLQNWQESIRFFFRKQGIQNCRFKRIQQACTTTPWKTILWVTSLGWSLENSLYLQSRQGTWSFCFHESRKKSQPNLRLSKIKTGLEWNEIDREPFENFHSSFFPDNFEPSEDHQCKHGHHSPSASNMGSRAQARNLLGLNCCKLSAELVPSAWRCSKYIQNAQWWWFLKKIVQPSNKTQI